MSANVESIVPNLIASALPAEFLRNFRVWMMDECR